MAGDWIPFDHDLPDKEEILAIASETGASVAEVVLRMCRLWCWFDRLTEDGIMRYIGVTSVTLKCGGDEAFWAAVEKVGWIIFGGKGRKDVSIPGFSERFGNSARRRLLTAKRVTAHRLGKKCNATSVTESLQNASQEPVSVSLSVSEPEPLSEPLSEPKGPASAGSSEPSLATDSEPAILVFPTVGRGPAEWPLTQAFVKELQAVYPNVNVVCECRKALLKIRKKAVTAKTAKGMPKFLTSWMDRTQNYSRSGAASGGDDPRGNMAAMQQYLDEVNHE